MKRKKKPDLSKVGLEFDVRDLRRGTSAALRSFAKAEASAKKAKDQAAKKAKRKKRQ